MRRRVKGIGISFLMLCCVAGILPATSDKTLWLARLFPTGSASGASPASFLAPSHSVAALETASMWFMSVADSIGAFFVGVYETIRDFFVSGQVQIVIGTAGHAVYGFAARTCLPLAAAVMPLLQRIVPALSTPLERVAVWIFWIIAAVFIIVLILVLRPRRSSRRPLPAVSTSPRPGAREGIQFGAADQGPVPTATAKPEQAASGKGEEVPLEETAPATQIAAASEQASAPLDVDIPEISLEPLGMIGEASATKPAEVPPAQESAAPPPLEFAAEEAEEIPAEPVESAPVEPLPEVFPDHVTNETAHEQEETPVIPESLMEQELVPSTEEMPVLPVEPIVESITETPAEETPAEPAAEVPTASEPAEQEQTPGEATELVSPLPPQEAPAPIPPENPVESDVLSALSEEARRFERAMASPVAPAETASPVAPSRPERSSIFTGDVDLDALIPEGVVCDASAVAQLFSGGYRSRISKLAISAKDLQNVPEEIRSLLKLTVVALSPIELSIARDVAMRLEAPGFVGEALLVAKKMGYLHYLTTYKNIPRNYKDVGIVETSSLRSQENTEPAEPTEGLISFN